VRRVCGSSVQVPHFWLFAHACSVIHIFARLVCLFSDRLECCTLLTPLATTCVCRSLTVFGVKTLHEQFLFSLWIQRGEARRPQLCGHDFCGFPVYECLITCAACMRVICVNHTFLGVCPMGTQTWALLMSVWRFTCSHVLRTCFVPVWNTGTIVLMLKLFVSQNTDTSSPPSP
jgi:hypothetical protein